MNERNGRYFTPPVSLASTRSITGGSALLNQHDKKYEPITVIPHKLSALRLSGWLYNRHMQLFDIY